MEDRDKHMRNWQCTDVPGMYYCPQSGATGMFNHVTGEVELYSK